MYKLLLILWMGWFANLMGQPVTAPVTTLQQILPVSEINGITSTLLNPAGLGAYFNDDGVLLNYNFARFNRERELNFDISFGDLAFGIQNFPMPEDITFRSYRIALAVGGQFLSVGTTAKLIELQYPHHFSRQFSFDMGVIFQPVSAVAIAATVKDINEPVLDYYRFGREYTSALRISLWPNRLRLLGQMCWNEHTSHLESCHFRLGVVFRPMGKLEVLVSALQNSDKPGQFSGMVLFPLFQGIRLYAGFILDETPEIQRYSASILIPLKTVTF